ncbi:MAG TPA: amidohydrolase family protein [Burkholderiales bacterium]|nr:amidohydrolase family protein [Burkholderiales bacterium]
MIIDAHHHLWKLSRGDYSWLDSRREPALAAIERDYLLEDYRAVARSHGVSGSVVVQAAPTVAETQWLLQQAKQSGGLIRGVVGWVDMAAKAAPDVLGRLARDRLLRGIRPMLQDIPEIDWVLQPALDPAFRAIIALDLRFDVLIRPPYLASALQALTRYPELRSVVDHGAKPDIAGGMWQTWADGIMRIAEETGAYCKISGLVTEASSDWTAGTLRRYVDHLLECFGTDRLIWGSDWPVATLASEYGRWLDTTAELLGSLPRDEREKVMAKNAISFYGLEAP